MILRMPSERLRLCARSLAVAALLLAPPALGAPAEPVFSETGPDAAAFGAADGYPLGTRATMNLQQHLVATYSRFDHMFEARRVARDGAVAALKRAPQELSLAYRYEGRTRSLDDYLARHPVTGLLIAKGDTILLERYRYGRTDEDRFLSQSMAKTITAMLIGIAVAEGAIASIDDAAAKYVPALEGSQYGATSIRALLHMASGVAFTERYDGKDDVSKMSRDLFRRDTPGAAAVVRQFDERVAPPGTRFHYASVETEVLGLVLRHAVNMPVADYAHERLWRKLGAEADASWVVDASGQETTYCCFNAVLRDYARLGLMLAHDGAWNGQQIVPAAWVVAATSVAAPYLAPRTATASLGYGYQTWIFPDAERQFALLGVRGQAIFVEPRSRLVLVHTAVRLMPARDPGSIELAALWRALVDSAGR
jgi:CubicO group peptidase (beta-lactamase class C family)